MSKMIWQNIAFSKASSAWAIARAALKRIANELDLVLQKQTSTFIDDFNIRIFLIYQEISRSQRVTKRKSYHLSSRNSSFENEKSMIFSLVSKRRLSDIIQTSIKIDIRRDKISLLTSSSSSQKSKLSYHIRNLSWILKLVFRAFCDKNQDINSSTCIHVDSFMNSINVSSFISSESSLFKKHALRHINKVSNESTSFVFVTSKLHDAFHRVFKMFTNSSIAIIDLELAKRLRTTQKKNSHSVTHSIKSLHLHSSNNYRGAADWLMWNEISDQAIICCTTIVHVMFTLSTSENEESFFFEAIRSAAYSSIARAHIRKTRTSLISHNDQAVDRLLCVLSISTSHLHDAIYTVITDWEFNAFRSERWKQKTAVNLTASLTWLLLINQSWHFLNLTCQFSQINSTRNRVSCLF